MSEEEANGVSGETAEPSGANEPSPASEPSEGREDVSGSGQPEADGTTSDQRGDQQTWNGAASGIPAADGNGEGNRPQASGVSGASEESLDERNEERVSRSRRVRSDFPGRGGPAFDVHGRARIGDMAGRDIHKYYTVASGEARARGPISTAYLARVAQVHVPTASDAILERACREDHVVFLRGRGESGRRSSAVSALDQLTRRNRAQSQVTVLDATSGLSGLATGVEEGHGHLLDASAADWLETVSEAQVAETLPALGPIGYLIILVDASATRTLPGVVVEHQPPEPGEVLRAHLAAKVTATRNVTPGLAQATITESDRIAANGLFQAALKISTEAAEWHAENTGKTGGPAAPAEAVDLAEAIWAWRGERAGDPSAMPRIRPYRELRLSRQARGLLQRGDRNDSPLRQAYVIAAAVLDGIAVSEVADGARQLAGLLHEVEHPGETEGRRIFAEPLARWLSHVTMTAPVPEPDTSRPASPIVQAKMPSRDLARAVIEVAWLDYDAARLPLLRWLVHLCGEHPDDRVRIRAAQALAVIAGHDYPQIRDKVLKAWSESDKPIHHQAAAWLLEAATLDGIVADRVETLLWRWSRSKARDQRDIAVRAYGTAAAKTCPAEAIRGVRFSAVDATFGDLPELALREMYVLGLHVDVLKELTFWTRAFAPMRERVGRVLVRVSRVRRPAEDGAAACFDLLWRMTYEPEKTGIDLAGLARLWKLACLQRGSRGAAWQMLGLWAQSCHSQPAMRATFTQLISEFDHVAEQTELRSRLRVYRRRWSTYLGQEDQR